MTLLLVGYGLVGAGLVGVLIVPRGRLALFALFVGGGALLSGLAALRVLAGGATLTGSTPSLLALSGASLRLDTLGAYFELVVSLVALASSVYLAGYARGRLASPGALGVLGLFVLALLVVPASGDVVSFLCAWETMAVTSLILVALEVERASARRAALWYGALTQGGAALLVIGLLEADHRFGTGSFAHWGTPVAGASSLVVLLASSLGFLSKVGLVPLHVWLPRAHPEAPTPVSALMSGAMTALGLYGFLRVDVTYFAGVDSVFWTTVSVLAALGAIYAAIHAASAHDLKRLLAYSTIDVMSLAVALVSLGALTVRTSPPLASGLLVAALSLVGAHALYKPLLFLGAGSLERASGTRDLDLLGGLLRRMPLTSSAMIVGAAAAVGVPLTTGFAAEWLSLQSLFSALIERRTTTTLLASLVLVALALAAGLVTLAMGKLVGIGLLSRPRSPQAATATEGRGLATGVLVSLAASVLGLGIWTGWIAAPARVTCEVVRCASGPVTRSLSVESLGAHASTRPFVLAIALLVALVVVLLTRRLARAGVRETIAWACGRASLSSRMQYTATSFAEPVERVFVDVVQPRADLDIVGEETRREQQVARGYRRESDDVVERLLYQPVIEVAHRLGRRARVLASGGVNLYAGYGFVALLILLVVVSR